MRLAAILAALLFATGCVSVSGGTEPSAQSGEAVGDIGVGAMSGDADAQAALGFELLRGHGVPRDCRTAMKYFLKAANQGEVSSQLMLGELRREGCGTMQKSRTKSLEWFRLAADQGNAIGQYEVGVAYLDGDTVPQDDVEANEWFRLAADQGHIGAAFNIGLLNERGMGLLQNYSEAEKRYLQSAKQGHVAAQSQLGTLYATGPKMFDRPVEAYAWLSVAVASGDKSTADLRDNVARLLSAEQFTEAQKLAAEYFEKYNAKNPFARNPSGPTNPNAARGQ